jgi:hypothetical protein
MKLLPGIVWALDETALKLVRRWQEGLPEKARNVFRVAASWEECADILGRYREQDFDRVMLAAGLSLDTQRQGRRVNVAVVASLTGEKGMSWDRVEHNLASIAQTLTLEQHRILLHAEVPPLGESTEPGRVEFTGIEVLTRLPWLLTRVNSGNLILNEQDFFNSVAALLDALFLAEREGGSAPDHCIGAFFTPPATPGKVRLAGFSRLPLDQVVQEVAEFLAAAVLVRAYDKVYEKAPLQAFEQKLAGWVGEFLQGRLLAQDLERKMPMELKWGRMPAAVILREGRRIFEKENERLQRAIPETFPPASCLARFWRWLVAKFRGSRPAASEGPSPLQREYLVKYFARLAEVIGDMADRARAGSGAPHTLPPAFVQVWSDELSQLVFQRLNNPYGNLEVHPSLAEKIARDVAAHFQEALNNWQVDNASFQELKRGLEEGNLLRFSARLRGGLPVAVQALVTSLKLGGSIHHGAQHVACVTLRFWPGRPPRFIAASEPVSVENLAL